MAWNTNLGRWLGGSARDRELRELKEGWERAQDAWRASPIGRLQTEDPVGALSLEINKALWARHDTPTVKLAVAIGQCIAELLSAEAIGRITPTWELIQSDVSVAVEFRETLAHRSRYALEFERLHGAFTRHIYAAFDPFFEALPPSALERSDDDNGSFDVPLIELLENPVDLIQRFVTMPYDQGARSLGLFSEYRKWLRPKVAIASGLPPDTETVDRADRWIFPTGQRGKSPSEVAKLYLGNSEFETLFEVPISFHLKEEVRFEHCHIIGGTGHGKTQLMQRMIHADLVKATRERRSVVVVDSQGDMINRLSRLALFDPEAENSLADRLILIDPADVEFPPSLNLFDAHTERLGEYRLVDQERVLNGVVETYEGFFGDLLGAELTQKQGVVFKYLARLMLTIPGATIHTLMQLMEHPGPYRPYMAELQGAARYFFQTEFFEPAFAQTKKQILRRLWGVLATPAFERMFAQKANKLDLYQAMQDGKIILVSTAKDLLKDEGSALFGRFFIGQIAQAALERSAVAQNERTPTTVYVDEAQEYFDDRIETILTQTRKYRVGITLAHQTLDQLTPRLRSAIHANTSVKCAGGVSAKDARALSDELHTTSDFIEGMKRRKDRTEFAAWIKNETPGAIRLGVPLGFLEQQPVASEEAYEALLESNRRRYCGTLIEVNEALRSLQSESAPRPAKPPERPAPQAAEGPSSKPAQPERPTVADQPQRRGAEPPEPKPMGKGGSQHTYVQHLVKTLAEERGFRVVLEEAVEGGQVDVGLHRGELSIACEISVTSKSGYEAQNLGKCVRAGFTRVWAVAQDARRLKAIRRAAEERLGPDLVANIEFLTTEEIVERLDDLAVPETEETTVRGYKVKVSRKVVGVDEAAERRRAIARILANARGRRE